MGRLRERYASEEEFCRAMVEEFHRVAGLLPREAEIEQRMRGYADQITMLDAVARKRGLTNPLDLGRTRQAVERSVFLGPEVKWGTPLAVIRSMDTPTGSYATFGFRFAVEPEWDIDDVAQYACSFHCLRAFRHRLVNRWLAPRAKFVWEGEERAAAADALARAFHPLVEKLLWQYRGPGKREFGQDYAREARADLHAWLPRWIQEFDYFWKQEQQLHGGTLPMPDLIDRVGGTVYDSIEYPVSAFVHSRLTTEIRSFLALPRRNENRVRGPYRVAGHSGLVGLRWDVEEELDLSDNAIRGHRSRGNLVAWKLDEFRKRLGLLPDSPVELVPEQGHFEDRSASSPAAISAEDCYESRPGDGEDPRISSGNWINSPTVTVSSPDFWVFDWDSVLAMHRHWDGRSYRFSKPGPTAKAAPPS